MRAHPVVCFFTFTSSPACRNVMCNSELGVKVLPISLHLLGEHLSGISDGSKKVGEERELGARVGEGGEDAKSLHPYVSACQENRVGW